MTEDSRGTETGKSVTGEKAALFGAALQPSGPSRRHFLTGIGGIGIMAATGIGIADAAPDANAARRGLTATPETKAARALGPELDMALGTDAFTPLGSTTYENVAAGGIRVTAGGMWFDAALRLPVGTRVTRVYIYLDPNGSQRLVLFVRYQPVTGVFQDLSTKLSTNGTAREVVTMTANFPIDVTAGWNYRIGQVRLDAGGAILYGARIKYRLPV